MIRKKVGNCEIKIKEVNGRVTFKCKNLKRAPMAQEIINEIKDNKIKMPRFK